MPSNSYLKRKYGITLNEYNLMYYAQFGTCFLCRTPFEKPDGSKIRIYVDHCHTCNKVRGLLCFQCNRYIVAKNNDASAEELAVYLKGSHSDCKASARWRKQRRINLNAHME